MGRYIYGGLCTAGIKGANKHYLTTRTYCGVDTHSTACTTWVVPTGVTCATFEIWGGGGAGAPQCCCQCYQGQPGSGGAYSMKTIPVTPGATYSFVVGCGGCANECCHNSNACGCQGGTTYVTGTGLTNFCAAGGEGGYWCNAGVTNSGMTSNRAQAYGGEINLPGIPAQMFNCSYSYGGNCSIALTGGAPFGGGWQPTLMAVGQCQVGGACGVTGSFPGGGGGPRPVMTTSSCDCSAMCAGAGADGLIIITT
jgi:hypothetical protein